MENSRTNLKIASFIVLLFAALTLVQLISELCFGEINNAVIPDGAPANVLLITKVVVISVSFICLLPQVYIGIKGLMMAKNPTSSRVHIIIAIVLFALTAIGLISPAVAIIKKSEVGSNVSEIFSVLLELVIFYDYIVYAKKVADENQ